MYDVMYTCVLVLQINERHEFLSNLIGSKEEEDRSYKNADEVMKATTSCMIVFSLLEIAIYYVYNYQVRLSFVEELRKWLLLEATRISN